MPRNSNDLVHRVILSKRHLREVWNHDLGNSLTMHYYPGYKGWPVGVRLRRGANRIELRAIGNPEQSTNCHMTRLTFASRNAKSSGDWTMLPCTCWVTTALLVDAKAPASGC
jgi:hypothetical protein